MTTGILPLDELKPKMVANTAFFETSQTVYPDAYGVTSGNWDNAGMSLGALQINFGAANRLSPYFQYMINNYDSFCNDLWLNNGLTQTDYNNWKTLMLGSDLTAKHDWADSISNPGIGKNGRAKGDLNQPYVEIFRQMGIHPASIDKQVEISETNYMPAAFQIFNQMSCKSRLALASFYDLNINRGRCWPLNLIQVDLDAIDANNAIDEVEKERQKIYQINWRGCFDNNNSDQGEIDNWETNDGLGGYGGRRKLMADQAGSYFGAIYTPESSFDMTQDIATEEKASHALKMANTFINKCYFGSTEILKVYTGTEMTYSKPYKTGTAPVTGFRKQKNYFTDLTGSVAMQPSEKLWVDVKNWIACRTYYTKDGSTPTINSPLYTNALQFDASCTLKTLTVSVEGIAEAVKTLTVTVAVAPTTTISPSTVVQNNIPITITLTTDEPGAAIKYKLGTSETIYNYTAPFTVSQNSPGVASTQIKVRYWAVGASATEAEKTIIYDTANSTPGTPTLTATAGNNQVVLSWNSVPNATSYTVLRDGAILAPSQYMTGTTYTDTTAVNGVQYSYVVQAANYGKTANSAAKTATPAAPAQASYRYLRIEGYGAAESGQEVTTRTVELEAYVGSTNVALNKTIVSGETPSTGGAALSTVVNGNKTTVTAGSYPIWWTATPNGHVVIDLGSSQALTKLSYYGYSINGVQRTNRFKIQGSNTNNGTDWVDIWDNSTGQAGLQPILPAGYDKIL